MDQWEDQTMTDQECLDLLQGNSDLNRARQVFRFRAAAIEQMLGQRPDLSPVEVRKMEFEAIIDICAALRLHIDYPLPHRTTAPSA